LLNVGDYLRILYRRRWTAGLALLLVFMYGTFNTLRKTPIYEATTKLLIEKDPRRATSLNAMLDSSEAYFEENFYETQYQVLQSRALAWQAAQAIGLKPDAVQQDIVEPQSWTESATSWVMDLVGAPKTIAPPPADESTAQAALTNRFLGGLSVVPVRNTHIVELRYRSPNPELADLLSGKSMQNNVPNKDGDTVVIPKSEPVFVYGNVGSQGAIYVKTGTTVQQALSMAGGVTDRGSTSGIKIQRVVDGEKQEIKVKDITKDLV
jgi:uncharacterized protein involved in exopolysaccharide biosynthesis